MASEVSICNIALTVLGAQRILDLDEDTENARRCNAVFDDLRDEVLITHPWNFAIVRAALAQLSTAPSYGYTYAYQLPSDCLRVLDSDTTCEYKIEGRTIVTDDGAFNIRYISRITDPSQFNAAFVTAFAERLAAELAYAFTSSNSLRESMLKVYQMKHAFAKAFDGQEGSPQVSETDTLTNSRE